MVRWVSECLTVPVRRCVFLLLPLSCVSPVPFLSSCRSPEERNWPFPEVDVEVVAAARRGDPAPAIAVFQGRVAGIESLYAELTMTIEGGERSGVFDTVVYYQAPHQLRITAFRDLLVATRDVFDLVLSESSYVLRLDDDGEEQVHRGAVSDLGAAHEGFEVFQLLRERIFLPGIVFAGESVRSEAQDDVLSVTVSTASGEVTWVADARTLGIRTATARGPDRELRVEIEYLSHRHVDDVYLPERFRLVEVASGLSLSGWLRHVEVNPELDPAVLEEPFVE